MRSTGPTTTARRTTVPSGVRSGTSSSRFMWARLAAEPEAQIKSAYFPYVGTDTLGVENGRRDRRAPIRTRCLVPRRRATLRADACRLARAVRPARARAAAGLRGAV